MKDYQKKFYTIGNNPSEKKKRNINKFNFFRTGSPQINSDLKNTCKRQKEHITIKT